MSAPAFETRLVNMVAGLPADPGHPDHHLFAAARTWVEEMNGRGEEDSPEAKASLDLWTAAENVMLYQDASTAEGMTVKLAMIAYHLDINQVDDFLDNETAHAGFNILASLHRSAFNIAAGKGGCLMTDGKPDCPALNLSTSLKLADAAYNDETNTPGASGTAAYHRREAVIAALSRVQASAIPGAIVQLAVAENRAAVIADIAEDSGDTAVEYAAQIERLTRSARNVFMGKFGKCADLYDIETYTARDPFAGSPAE